MNIHNRNIRILWLTMAGLATAFAAELLAQCYPPDYDVNRRWDGSDVFLSVSIPLRDFTPERILCLAGAIKRRYTPRKKIGILIFNTFEAARNYMGPPVEHDPDYRKYAEQEHAFYSFDDASSEEFILLNPLGIDFPAYEMRIDLPVQAIPPCRFQLHGRCLLEYKKVKYPSDALKMGAVGTVTLAGSIGVDGHMTDIRVVETAIDPVEGKDLLLKESVVNLEKWQLERSLLPERFQIRYTFTIDPSFTWEKEREYVQLALPDQVHVRSEPYYQPK